MTREHDADVESYTSGNQSVKVSSEGLDSVVIQVKAKLDTTPEEVMGILTAPNSHEIFRSASKQVCPATSSSPGP